MFGQGSYATVWEVKDEGNYSVVSISTSKKNPKTNEYETDFSTKFARFIGKAHEEAKGLKPRDRIKLGNCGVTAKFDPEKEKIYTNFCVFSFELAGNSSAAGNRNEKNPAKAPKKDFKKLVEVDPVEEDDDDELPF